MKRVAILVSVLLTTFIVSPTFAIQGDFNEDCLVDLADFATLSSAWQTSRGDPNWNPICDISDPNDSLINIKDLTVFAEYWLEQEDSVQDYSGTYMCQVLGPDFSGEAYAKIEQRGCKASFMPSPYTSVIFSSLWCWIS